MVEVIIGMAIEKKTQTPQALGSTQKMAYEAMLNRYPDAENFKWDSFEVDELNSADTTHLKLSGPGTYYYLIAEV